MAAERELHDDALEEEIELLSDVMERASQTQVPLHQDQVDQALGVDPSPRRDGTESNDTGSTEGPGEPV